jgi:folylpolyglutamate synthase
MAFHTYVSEGVDVAVIECGVGGEYDSTNILTRPVVTGITSLGIDHTATLGDTIEQIAWHKAGIMKHGAKCFTSTGQQDAATQVLQERAKEKGVELRVVTVGADVESGKTKLGLQADFQKANASLAVAIAREWLGKKGIAIDDDSARDKIKRGLEDVQWDGRCETRRELGITWYIDGGHTLESIELVGRWFAAQVQSQPRITKEKPKRVLIFNQQTRDADALARGLQNTLSTALGDETRFTHAIFCTNTTFEETGFRPDLISVNISSSDVQKLHVQNRLAATWTEIDPSTHVQVFRTIEEAVAAARAIAKSRSDAEDVTVLVTGSLHLVGGFLEVLETLPNKEG